MQREKWTEFAQVFFAAHQYHNTEEQIENFPDLTGNPEVICR